jgi:hypothetical protein
VLKKSSLQGLRLEAETSTEFHRNALPILVSSSFLRSRQLGQLDLVKLVKNKKGLSLEVAEVKSSQMGTEATLRHQRRRLMASASYLASLFGLPVKFTDIVG